MSSAPLPIIPLCSCLCHVLAGLAVSKLPAQPVHGTAQHRRIGWAQQGGAAAGWIAHLLASPRSPLPTPTPTHTHTHTHTRTHPNLLCPALTLRFPGCVCTHPYASATPHRSRAARRTGPLGVRVLAICPGNDKRSGPRAAALMTRRASSVPSRSSSPPSWWRVLPCAWVCLRCCSLSYCRPLLHTSPPCPRSREQQCMRLHAFSMPGLSSTPRVHPLAGFREAYVSV